MAVMTKSKEWLLWLKHGQVTPVKHAASQDNNEVVAGSKHSAMNMKQNANKDWQSTT
jgi:hypothetical protein